MNIWISGSVERCMVRNIKLLHCHLLVCVSDVSSNMNLQLLNIGKWTISTTIIKFASDCIYLNWNKLRLASLVLYHLLSAYLCPSFIPSHSIAYNPLSDRVHKLTSAFLYISYYIYFVVSLLSLSVGSSFIRDAHCALS